MCVQNYPHEYCTAMVITPTVSFVPPQFKIHRSCSHYKYQHDIIFIIEKLLKSCGELTATLHHISPSASVLWFAQQLYITISITSVSSATLVFKSCTRLSMFWHLCACSHKGECVFMCAYIYSMQTCIFLYIHA